MEIDEVDTFLATQPGKIERKKTIMCRHNDRQKCTNCLPIDVSFATGFSRYITTRKKFEQGSLESGFRKCNTILFSHMMKSI